MSKFEPVRLYQYPYNINHFVSVKGPHGWGIACYDMVNARAANVLCRVSQQMFGTRLRSASITGGSYIFYNGSMNCTGSEMSMKECNMTLVKQEKCANQEAVLDCSTGRCGILCRHHYLNFFLTFCFIYFLCAYRM